MIKTTVMFPSSSHGSLYSSVRDGFKGHFLAERLPRSEACSPSPSTRVLPPPAKTVPLYALLYFSLWRSWCITEDVLIWLWSVSFPDYKLWEGRGLDILCTQDLEQCPAHGVFNQCLSTGWVSPCVHSFAVSHEYWLISSLEQCFTVDAEMSQNLSLARSTEVQKLQKQHTTLVRAQGPGADTALLFSMWVLGFCILVCKMA